MAVVLQSLSVLGRSAGKNTYSLGCVTRMIRCFSQESAPQSLVDVQVNSDTGFATMTLQRKPVNSLNLELLTEIGDALKELEKNKCRGLILTSASSSVFSAGLDIMEMYKPDKNRASAFWGTLQNTWLQLYSTPFPTVAAINGHSPAGGCLMALGCEYRVMVGPQFTIGLNETQLGIIAPPWFEMAFRNTIGARQSELALTQGKLFTVEEALKVGLIDEVATSKEDAISRAEKFLMLFKNIPAAARKLTKDQSRAPIIQWMEENRIEDLKVFVDFVNQPAVQKGFEMYLQKLQKK